MLVPGGQGVRKRQGQDHLRRHQRNHEGAHFKKNYKTVRCVLKYVQCVPRKGFGSAVYDTIYTIYISCALATTNSFRGTHCI